MRVRHTLVCARRRQMRDDHTHARARTPHSWTTHVVSMRAHHTRGAYAPNSGHTALMARATGRAGGPGGRARRVQGPGGDGAAGGGGGRGLLHLRHGRGRQGRRPRRRGHRRRPGGPAGLAPYRSLP